MPTGRERFGQLLFYGVVVLVAYLALIVIQPFLAALAWAAILAMTLNPLRRWLVARMRPTHAALVTTLVAALVIVGPFATLVTLLANDIPRVVEFIQRLPEQATPERVRRVWGLVRQQSPVRLPADPSVFIGQAAQGAIAFLAPKLGGFVADVAATLGSLFVMLFGLFFLVRDGDRLADSIRRLLPFPDRERDRLIAETRDLVIASVGAGLTVAFVQGCIGGLSFWMLGAAAPVVWGTAIAICSLIPVVGATLVWVPVAGWWLLSGEVARGLILVGVGAGVIGLVDNVLRPMLLSGRTSVNGLVIFIGLLGGVGAFGFVGLVLGPIVLVTAGTLIDALTRPPEREGPVE
jgi:predicted PurR-regulated permease PerM